MQLRVQLLGKYQEEGIEVDKLMKIVIQLEQVVEAFEKLLEKATTYFKYAVHNHHLIRCDLGLKTRADVEKIPKDEVFPTLTTLRTNGIEQNPAHVCVFVLHMHFISLYYIFCCSLCRLSYVFCFVFVLFCYLLLS